MKFKVLLLIPILLFIFTACQPAIRLVFGLNKPQIENPNSVIKFTNEVGIGEKNVFAVDTLGYQKIGNYLGTSGFHFFDTEGKKMVKPEGCAPGDSNYVEQIINSHENRGIFQGEAAYDFEDISNYFTELNGENTTIESDSSSYKVVFLWANYMGDGRVKRSLNVLDQIKNSNHTFEIYYLNMDMQEFWGLEENVPMKVKIGK